MNAEQPDFATAQEVFRRALRAHKAKRPRTNLLKCAWVLVHETSPQYEAAAKDALVTMGGFVLARGGGRLGWADRFPKDVGVCLVSIGEDQRAFPFRVQGAAEEGSGEDRLLDALGAIFDGAAEADRPEVLRGRKPEPSR